MTGVDLDNMNRRLNEEWQVERNYGIRWISSRKTGLIIIDGLTKEMAFHLVELHNEWLQKKREVGE